MKCRIPVAGPAGAAALKIRKNEVVRHGSGKRQEFFSPSGTASCRPMADLSELPKLPRRAFGKQHVMTAQDLEYLSSGSGTAEDGSRIVYCICCPKGCRMTGDGAGQEPPTSGASDVMREESTRCRR